MNQDIVAHYMAQAEALRQRLTQERLSFETAIFNPDSLKGFGQLELDPSDLGG